MAYRKKYQTTNILGQAMLLSLACLITSTHSSAGATEQGSESDAQLFERAMNYRRAENYKECRVLMLSFLKRHPGNPDCLHRLVECEANPELAKEADLHLSELKRVQPNNQYLPYLSCLVPWCSYRFELAMQRLVAYKKAGTTLYLDGMLKDAERRTLTDARELINQGKVAEAKRLLQLLSQLNSNHRLTGEFCRELAERGDIKGMDLLTGGVMHVARSETNPDNALAIVETYSNLRHPDAISAFEILLKRFPKHGGISTSQIAVEQCRQLRSVSLKRALEQSRLVIQDMPPGVAKTRLEGFICECSRKPDEALALYSRAIEMGSNNPDALLDRANLYMQLFIGDKALADCTAAIKLRPGDARAYLLRSTCYRNFMIDPQLARQDRLKAKELSLAGQFKSTAGATMRSAQ